LFGFVIAGCLTGLSEDKASAPTVQGTMRRVSPTNWDKFYVLYFGERPAERPEDTSSKVALSPGRQKLVLGFSGHRVKPARLVSAGPVEAEVTVTESSRLQVDGVRENDSIIYILKDQHAGAELFRSAPQELFKMFSEAHLMAGVSAYFRKRVDGRFEVFADGSEKTPDEKLKLYWRQLAEKVAAGRPFEGAPSVALYEYTVGYSFLNPYIAGTRKTGKRAYGILELK
jgi:hypothetical protein